MSALLRKGEGGSQLSCGLMRPRWRRARTLPSKFGRIGVQVLPMVAAVASGEQVNLAGVGFPRCQETKQILIRANRAGLEFALGVVFASVNCRWDFPLGSVYIDYFQRTTFCHAASGVETHSSKRAIVMSLQPPR
jgi:hypothetical protein